MKSSISITGVDSGNQGFEMKISNPIQFYATNYVKSKVFIFDEDWNYVSNKSFNKVNYMISIENFFWISGDENIWKTDEELNVLIQYNSTGLTPGYTGLYFNSTNNLIYVAAYSLSLIKEFNLNVTVNDIISTTPNYPLSISGYNNQLYVSTESGMILVIVGKQIITNFNGCNGQINSMLFDGFDNMATVCDNFQLYLYNTNGDYLNKTILTVDYPCFIGFDFKSRLVVVEDTQISLYY